MDFLQPSKTNCVLLGSMEKPWREQGFVGRVSWGGGCCRTGELRLLPISAPELAKPFPLL